MPMAEAWSTLFWIPLALLIIITIVIVILSNTYARKVRNDSK